MSCFTTKLSWIALAAALSLSPAAAEDGTPRIIAFEHTPTVAELSKALDVEEIARLANQPGAKPAISSAAIDARLSANANIKDGPQPNTWVRENIRFENGSNRIYSTHLGLIDTFGVLLQEQEAFTLVISGHANATGPNSVNDELSRQRTLAVAEYISSVYDIPSDRLDLRWLGARAPLPGTDPAAPENRRVQFGVLPQR